MKTISIKQELKSYMHELTTTSILKLISIKLKHQTSAMVDQNAHTTTLTKENHQISSLN